MNSDQGFKIMFWAIVAFPFLIWIVTFNTIVDTPTGSYSLIGGLFIILYFVFLGIVGLLLPGDGAHQKEVNKRLRGSSRRVIK